MTCTLEIVSTKAAALTRQAFWTAKGDKFTATIDEVGLFTVFDYRTTPSALLVDGVPVAPATTVWLVRVMITA